MRHCWGTTPVFQTEEHTGVEGAQWSGGSGRGSRRRQLHTTLTYFACNSPEQQSKRAQKPQNINDPISKLEIWAGELHATLLGNHPDQRGGRTHRQAAPVTWRCTRYVALHPLRGTTPVTSRCTRYVALHPIRTGALPTDRVHRTTLEHTTEDSAAPARITHGQELTKAQEPRAPPATTGHGLTRSTSQPTGRARKPHP